MGTLNEDLSAIKAVEDTIIANKVAKFAYTDEAYNQNDANGVTEYNVNNAQNIPTADPSVLKVNDTVLSKGYRSQASSITRMLMNHFLGRLSYNVNKVNDGFSNLVATLIKHRGTANGFATLDENGRIPFSQLPESAMEYKGQWNAETNTPTLANGTGTKGDFYIVSVAGTHNFGSGDIQFFVNDRVIYDGSVWSRLSAGEVKTVNNQTPVNGNISITGNNITVSAKDSTDIGNKILYQPRDLQAESRFNGDLYNQCILNGTYTADKYVSNDGTLTDREGLGASDYLPVVAGSLYKCELTNNAQQFWSDAGCIYDSTHTKIATISSLANSSPDHVFVMPDNASYVRLTLGISSANGSSTNFFKRLDALQINSVLKGKKIAVLGDSITYGFGLDNQEQRYTNVLARISGATVLNYGVSGSKMSEIAGDTVASFVERVSQIDTSCDKVVIFGGTNDYWHNKTEIGFRESSDASTFCGAINYLITYLENHGFTNKDIVFIVPQIQNYGGSNSFEDRGGHFGTFLDFRNALMRTCGYRGVPVIDLFTSSGIDVVSNDSLISYYTSDGLHLNFRGQYIVAKAIFDFFQTTRYVSMGTTQADSVGIELFTPNSPVSTLDFSNGFYEEKSCFALNSAFNDSPSNAIQLLKTFIGNGANGNGRANHAFQILAELTGTSPDLWFKNSQSSWFKVAKRNGAIAGLDCLDASSANILPTVGTVTANYLPSTTPNAPTNTKNWWVLTFRPTESLAIQMACAGNDYACRFYSAGTWSSWTFMAQAVALGDQVTYSLSENTLTITSK